MANTVIAPTLTEYPAVAAAPVVELAAAWGGSWVAVDELEFVSASLNAGGHDLDQCVVRYRYGQIRQPWETYFSAVTPAELIGYWLRVSFWVGPSLQPTWIGRISGEGREVTGASNGPTGVQEFVAYGPQHLLRRRHVSTSVWLDADNNEKTIGWLPPINDRHDGVLVGNRTANVGPADVYCFGGTELWNFADYIDYLLAYYMDDSDDGGPTWGLIGQREVLEAMSDLTRLRSTAAKTTGRGQPLHMGSGQTVAGILAHLIAPSCGIDYKILANADGFYVWVYALVADAVSFQGETLPANPDTVTIYTSQTLDSIRTHVARSSDQQYGTIRIRGAQIVVCCSLGKTDPNEDTTLVKVWDDQVETDYLAGTGTADDPAAAHDDARRRMQAGVFAQFGAPGDWDYQGGEAAPIFDDAGQFLDYGADFQNSVRHTLPWLPLLEGYDYSDGQTLDKNPAGVTPDLLRPLVWLQQDPADPLDDPIYYLADELGISVSVPQHDLGVFLSTAPPHRLALNHWEHAAPSIHRPEFDWESMIVTLAFRSDQRWGFEVVTGDGLQSDGILEIEAPDAELWYLAPNTVVGLDWFGQLKTSGANWRTHRTDDAKLRMAMAGALARYRDERCRAEITIKRLIPCWNLLGQILAAIEDGGESQPIKAPITSIHWTAGTQLTTTIRTGFAG